MMNRYIIVALVIAVGATGTIVSAQEAELQSVPAAVTARDIAGSGAFKADGKNPMPMQRWDLQVTRGDDNSISGRVNLGGSPLANAGNVQGHIVGTNVSGTVIDDDGNKVASFTGTVTANGITGMYTDRTGETGSWSWDGPPPK
jgi:hypothetical protein